MVSRPPGKELNVERVGLCLGFAGGVPTGLFAYYWFEDWNLTLTIMTAGGGRTVRFGANFRE